MRKLKIHGIYKHFKGDYYLVEEIAKDCDSLESVVFYRKLYDDGSCFVRFLKDFMDKVNHEKYPIEVYSKRDKFKGE